jgi:hypothetical protein
MSKKRTALRFASAGAITALYGLVVQQTLSNRYEQELKDKKIARKQVVITAVVLSAATWVATLA